jgi:AmmeMemoRadiSam system protein A
MDSSTALAETVVECAINSALQDPRFRPVGAEELARLRIEISVLSESGPIVPEDIEVGVHGLLVTCGTNRGLFLPQVAVERGWSRERFFKETCCKAGITSDAWRDPETRLFAFTAEVFSEADRISPVRHPAVV